VEHLGGDHVAGLDRAGLWAEGHQALAEEPAWWGALARVVARRLGTLADPAPHVVDQVLPGATAQLEGLPHREHCFAATSALSPAC
jgi:hypothetical protein